MKSVTLLLSLSLLLLFFFPLRMEAADAGNPDAVGRSALRAAAEKDWAATVKYASRYFRLPEKNRRMTAQVFHAALRAAMARRAFDAARSWAGEIPRARKLPPEETALGALLVSGLDGKNSDAAALEGIPAEKQETVLFQASNLFYLAGDYEKAKRFVRSSPEKTPSYPVTIVREAPSGIQAWMESPLLKRIRMADEFVPYNRKAAELLILDVNTVRGETAQSADTACPLRFCVAADRQGLSLYGEIPDERAEEIAAGLLPGGSLEMYLQPGEGEFYYQWLWSFFPEKVSFVNWMSPHRFYRPLESGFRHEVSAEDGMIRFCMRIDWEILYDRLPDGETRWTLGVIPWLRTGGFTWGNGGQVHELNRFGKLEFRGIGKILPDIRRRLVLSAWGAYLRNAPPLKVFWHDEIHGDRGFYKKILLPYLERLEAYGKSVSPEMSTETADELFREAVPEWFELKYRVAELRRNTLRRQLTEEENAGCGN